MNTLNLIRLNLNSPYEVWNVKTWQIICRNMCGIKNNSYLCADKTI